MFIYIILIPIVIYGFVHMSKSFEKNKIIEEKISEEARVYFKKHLDFIENKIENLIPSMKKIGITPLNIASISLDLYKIILEKEKLNNIDGFSDSQIGKKLYEMVDNYTSFIIDKKFGGIGSSVSQLDYKYGLFLRENGLSSSDFGHFHKSNEKTPN